MNQTFRNCNGDPSINYQPKINWLLSAYAFQLQGLLEILGMEWEIKTTLRCTTDVLEGVIFSKTNCSGSLKCPFPETDMFIRLRFKRFKVAF